jgi:serine protease Do
VAGSAAKVGIGLVVGVAAGVALGVLGPFELRRPLPAERVAALEEPVQPVAPDEHSPFALLAQRSSPGVVNVHTSKTVARQPLPFPRGPLPDIFREFFGERAPGPTPSPREFTVPSLGSGFVISEEGHIVTNNHVVDGVDRIEVIFHDGRKSEAEIVGQDPKTDLALIQVAEREGLHPLPLGDSDAILPGDWVVAIGNPFGLDHTVTVGIVSAKGRDIGQGPYDDFIQTDAAINPGNSGGPLLNMRGEVVGINTAITAAANTIGFAVPVNMAKEILPQLREQGYVTRGWLGVTVQPVTPEIARSFELPGERGALVAQVAPDGPAAQAGIERGDVILAFEGEPIEELRELPRAVSRTPVGETVVLEIFRDGQRRSLEVVVGRLDEPIARERVARSPGGAAEFGIEAQELTPELRERLGVDDPGGVLLSGVEPGSPAAAAGLAPGDVILEVDRRPVESLSDLARALEGASGALFLIRRGESTLFVPVGPPS